MIRRTFLAGLASALAAPAIIRTPGLLMPVRRVLLPKQSPMTDAYPSDDYVDGVGVDWYGPPGEQEFVERWQKFATA